MELETENGSRVSRQAAGWCCQGLGAWADKVPHGTKPVSWLNPRTLWRSRNDRLALLTDPTGEQRQSFVQALRQREVTAGHFNDFIIAMSDEPAAMVVLGDPGEGDKSQYAVVPALKTVSDTVQFGLVCSDVIYPSGDIYDYPAKYYDPYRDLTIPLYALPGNHDWYDSLAGFLYNFCNFTYDYGAHAPGSIIERLFWRKPREPSTDLLRQLAAERVRRAPQGRLQQPGPYFAIDVAGYRLISIDTGIRGTLDEEQYAWLTRVSLDNASSRPRILFTGNPIYVDDEYHPCPVTNDPSRTVDDIVTDPRANYVLAIGGDIHNYQHYPVRTGAGLIHYVVSGGGGAFMHATHNIPKVDIAGVDEVDFRCYPLRRDSLARFSQIIDKRLHLGGRLAVTPEEAATFLTQEKGINPLPRDASSTPPDITTMDRWKMRMLRKIRGGTWFHRLGSVAFDWNDPPMFKQFLKLSLDPQSVTVTCYSVNGCAESEGQPFVEEVFTAGQSGAGAPGIA